MSPFHSRLTSKKFDNRRVPGAKCLLLDTPPYTSDALGLLLRRYRTTLGMIWTGMVTQTLCLRHPKAASCSILLRFYQTQILDSIEPPYWHVWNVCSKVHR